MDFRLSMYLSVSFNACLGNVAVAEWNNMYDKSKLIVVAGQGC